MGKFLASVSRLFSLGKAIIIAGATFIFWILEELAKSSLLDKADQILQSHSGYFAVLGASLLKAAALNPLIFSALLVALIVAVTLAYSIVMEHRQKPNLQQISGAEQKPRTNQEKEDKTFENIHLKISVDEDGKPLALFSIAMWLWNQIGLLIKGDRAQLANQEEEDKSFEIPLEISVGEDGRYSERKYKGTNYYTPYRTLNLMVKNNHPRKTARDCLVKIESIIPPTERNTPFTLNLDKPETFHADGFAVIPFISYGEKEEGSSIGGNTFAQIETTEGRKPTLDVGKEYIIKLRATAFDMAASSEFSCKVWIDKLGRLRIAEVGEQTLLPEVKKRALTEDEEFEAGWLGTEDGYEHIILPLSDACRMAYENSLGSTYAIAAEHEASTRGEDALLDWYATWITTRLDVPLHGAKSPSTIQQLIDPSEYRSHVFCEGATRLAPKVGKAKGYIDLHVKKYDLLRALKQVSEP